MSYASALVLNIGIWITTGLSPMIGRPRRQQARHSRHLGSRRAGATKAGTEAAKKILDELAISVIRGNAGEI